MDSSEQVANNYLTSKGFKEVLYEPDGNIPPDFLVDKQIAVEVRRLNQHGESKGKARGLEEVAIPLWQRIESLLDSLGPPTSGESWFVSFQYRRPVEKWNTLSKKIKAYLSEFQGLSNRSRTSFEVAERFEVEVFKASKAHSTFFLLGGCLDQDSGGWVLPEIERNLRICLEEKTRKIEKYRDKYPEWWLILVDYIGYALNEFDRELFRDQVRVDHDWDKVILIDPKNHERAFEI